MLPFSGYSSQVKLIQGFQVSKPDNVRWINNHGALVVYPSNKDILVKYNEIPGNIIPQIQIVQSKNNTVPQDNVIFYGISLKSMISQYSVRYYNPR